MHVWSSCVGNETMAYTIPVPALRSLRSSRPASLSWPRDERSLAPSLISAASPACAERPPENVPMCVGERGIADRIRHHHHTVKTVFVPYFSRKQKFADTRSDFFFPFSCDIKNGSKNNFFPFTPCW